MPVTIARWKKIPERPMTTRELSEAFGFSLKLIGKWTESQTLHVAQVAVKGDDGYYRWDKHRLLLWLIACGYFTAAVRKKYQLPDKEEARARLGIPPESRIREKRG